MHTPEQIFVAIAPGKLEDILHRMDQMEGEIRQLKKALSDSDQFGALPPWVELKDAKRITGYSDGRTISKWVDRGVIRVQTVSDREKRYYKEDCLHFAERAQQWKIEND